MPRCPGCQRWRYQGSQADQAKKRKKTFFLELPMQRDVEELFKDSTFLNGLSYRHQRKSDPDFIRDIQDGQVYRDLMREGNFLSHPWNLALGVNCDGVSPYKSSSSSMWPIFWQIHDLPPALRFSLDYTRICGLWFGKSKPNMNLFFRPFHSEIKHFHGNVFFFSLLFLIPDPVVSLLCVEEGFPVTINGRRETSRGILLTVSADTPAKAEMQHFTHHNGLCGCPFCLNPGLSVSTELKQPTKPTKTTKTAKKPKPKQGSVHAYPCGDFPLRTKAQTLADAASAFKSGKPVRISFPFLFFFFFFFF